MLAGYVLRTLAEADTDSFDMEMERAIYSQHSLAAVKFSPRLLLSEGQCLPRPAVRPALCSASQYGYPPTGR